MFSSLQSLLPQALQQQRPVRAASPESVSDDEDHTRTPASEGPKRRPTKGSNETFIIVRPPPSKSNHPLNLQVQLVPPSSKDKSGSTHSRRASVDEQGALARTESRRSTDGSSTIYSSYSSAASVASVGSTASTTSSGRRMIIPLYNLQAHNVMTNVIADAGTDAKIAKFYKRGLEIIGLAVLEPTEVHGAGGQPTALDAGGALLAPSVSIGAASLESASPAASRYSLSSAGHTSSPPAEAAATPTATPDPKGSAKKMFGRFFKKREASSASARDASPAPRDRSPSGAPSAGLTPRATPSKRASLLLPVALPGAGAPAEPAVFLMPAVLGIQPVLSAATFPPQGRSSTYTWTVRRWLKGAPESALGAAVASVFDSALRTAGGRERGAGALVELRFEWTRGAKKGSRRTRDAAPSAAHSVASLHSQAPSAPGSRIVPRGSVDGRSETSHSASAAHSLRSGGGGDGEDDDEDSGAESDPEDSETPWTCTLLATAGGAERVRAKVASLSPTPHHPKVVAALKVPFPLPDVDVDAPALRPRVLTPAGVARPALEPQDSSESGARRARERVPLVLTAEEIKDVVSATGMWLVVREHIGGVGRVNRKGDGWKIRG